MGVASQAARVPGPRSYCWEHMFIFFSSNMCMLLLEFLSIPQTLGNRDALDLFVWLYHHKTIPIHSKSNSCVLDKFRIWLISMPTIKTYTAHLAVSNPWGYIPPWLPFDFHIFHGKKQLQLLGYSGKPHGLETWISVHIQQFSHPLWVHPTYPPCPATSRGPSNTTSLAVEKLMGVAALLRNVPGGCHLEHRNPKRELPPVSPGFLGGSYRKSWLL